jgi:deazaflavin-dependent oxidoreductase (nitroreductase family)
MARRGSLGVFRNGEDEVKFEGVTVPQRLHVQSLGLGGDPDMFAEFEISDGKAECSRIEWRRSRGGRAVLGSDVHEIADLDSYVNDAFLRYSRVIAEFRANEGKVGGQFAGAPLVLVHHRNRDSGKVYVAPVFYMRAEEPATIYVFATLGGGMRHPNWYLNLVAAGAATVELGTETYHVAVEEVVGAERDRIYAEQARRYPVFGEYERLNAGVRTIPVLALRRAGG